MTKTDSTLVPPMVTLDALIAETKRLRIANPDFAKWRSVMAHRLLVFLGASEATAAEVFRRQYLTPEQLLDVWSGIWIQMHLGEPIEDPFGLLLRRIKPPRRQRGRRRRWPKVDGLMFTNF